MDSKGFVGLKVPDEIQMFKPKRLKDAISLARMKDDQLSRQIKLTLPPNDHDYSSSPNSKSASTMKHLTGEEMQKRVAQGLCFRCDEKLTPSQS